MSEGGSNGGTAGATREMSGFSVVVAPEGNVESCAGFDVVSWVEGAGMHEEASPVSHGEVCPAAGRGPESCGGVVAMSGRGLPEETLARKPTPFEQTMPMRWSNGLKCADYASAPINPQPQALPKPAKGH